MSALVAQRWGYHVRTTYEKVHSRTAGLSFHILFWGSFSALGTGAGSTGMHFGMVLEFLMLCCSCYRNAFWRRFGTVPATAMQCLLAQVCADRWKRDEVS